MPNRPAVHVPWAQVATVLIAIDPGDRYQPSPNFSASITPVPQTMVPNRLRFHT